MRVGNNYSGPRWAFSQSRSEPSPFKFRALRGERRYGIVIQGVYEVRIDRTGKVIGRVEKDAGGRNGSAFTTWKAVTPEGRAIGIRFGTRRAASQALFRAACAVASPDGEASRGA